jgi:hypothetical protein
MSDVGSRLVTANQRSMCLMSGFPEIAVIWCTIASGRADATASPAAPSFAALVAAVTSCPRATNYGTSRRPSTSAPPATNIRMTFTLSPLGSFSDP